MRTSLYGTGLAYKISLRCVFGTVRCVANRKKGVWCTLKSYAIRIHAMRRRSILVGVAIYKRVRCSMLQYGTKQYQTAPPCYVFGFTTPCVITVLQVSSTPSVYKGYYGVVLHMCRKQARLFC